MPTKFYAKLLGLWLVLVALGLTANREALPTINALFADPALVFITGVFTVVVGIAVVVSHNRWSGGAAAVIVTVYGWLALVKGLLWVAFPAPTLARFYEALHLQQYFFAYLFVALVIGGYLAYEGFRTTEGALGGTPTR